MKRYAFPINLLLWGVLFFLLRWPAWNILVSLNLALWMLWWHYLIAHGVMPPPGKFRVLYLIAALALAASGIVMWREALPAFGLVLLWGTASLMGHHAFRQQQK